MPLWLIIIALVIGIILLIIVFALWSAKKRREALQRFSSEIMFSYDAKPTNPPHKDNNQFELFNKGHSHKSLNLMKGSHLGTEIVVFDYQYTVGGGNSSHTYHQTVGLVQIPGKNLPRFILGPQTFSTKVGKKFGKNDINFDSNPTFSKRYFLKGDDVSRIRQLFNMQIQNFFDNHLSIIRVEGNADTLIIFKKTVKPEDMRGFISEVSEIRNVFAFVKI